MPDATSNRSSSAQIAAGIGGAGMPQAQQPAQQPEIDLNLVDPNIQRLAVILQQLAVQPNQPAPAQNAQPNQEDYYRPGRWRSCG